MGLSRHPDTKKWYAWKLEIVQNVQNFVHTLRLKCVDFVLRSIYNENIYIFWYKNFAYRVVIVQNLPILPNCLLLAGIVKKNLVEWCKKC